MFIIGTHFNYYLICHRKLWLFANGINMESNSDLVYEGKTVSLLRSYGKKATIFLPYCRSYGTVQRTKK